MSSHSTADGKESIPRLEESPTLPQKKGLHFWLIFLAIALASFQTVLEISAIGISLPVIAADLKATDFVWVGSAYALSASCALPMTGGLAQVFGRRYVMAGSLVIFAVGAAICGSAANMQVLIVGRTIQGIGGGGIMSLPSIILSDLVSLKERGAYNGLLGLALSMGIATSGVIGGELSAAGQWRWIFYINVPLSVICLVLVLAFLRVPAPKGSILSKLKQLDWIGNFIVVASTCLCCIALTWAGVTYPWASVQVLVPLCLGLVGLVVFVIYENNVVGYLITFLNSLLTITATYYFPVYLQACKGDTTAEAGGIDWVGFSTTLGPFGIIAGLSVVKLNRYRPSIFFGWILMIIALGLWTRLDVNTSRPTTIGFEVLMGLGTGTVYTTTYFPVLAPLPVTANARALAFFNFCRSFAQVWGVTIGASVLQNELLQRLPADFVARLPRGVAVAYSAIPQINDLPEPLRSAVREAFSKSTRTIWIVLLGIASAGSIFLLLMKEVKMHDYTDSDWGIEEKAEKDGSSATNQERV